jgi:anti-anti-sigma factor
MNTRFETRHFAVRISARREALIETRGELDIASVPTFQVAIRNLDLSRHERVVLDLRRLSFIDAAGLHAVLDLHEACREVSSALTVLPGPRQVQRVFELTGAEQLVRFTTPITGGSNGTSGPLSAESGSGGLHYRGFETGAARQRREERE